MINSLSKTYDFIKHDEIANEKWRAAISEKIKIFPLVCSKYLSSWTGLGKTGHVRFRTFGRIFYVLGSKFGF